MSKINNKIKRHILGSIAMLSLLVVGLLGSSAMSTQAGLNICSGLGVNLDNNVRASRDPINADASSRKWTVEELFSKSVRFTTYNGEGEGTWLLADTADRGAARNPHFNDEDVQQKLKSQNLRNLTRCAMPNDAIITGLANFIMGISSFLVNITKFAASFLFKTDLLCNGNDTGACFNIMGVLGGQTSGDGGGIIGVLTRGLYLPLTVIAGLFLAFNVIYNGLIKMQFRKVLTDIIISFVAFAGGLMFLLNPTLLVKAPQAVTSAISVCIVDAMNGESCVGQGSGIGNVASSFIGPECMSDASGASKGEMMVNGLTCGIWKTFVLEPWAQGQFGVPYNELYVSNPPAGGKVWAGKPDDTPNYSIHLGSSGSASSYTNGPIELTEGPQISNLALYHLYLSTDVHDSANFPGDGGRATNPGTDLDERWYDIIVPLTNDASMFLTWSGANSAARLGHAFTSLIATVLAGSLITILSIFGIMYQIAGTVLMVFAPLFLLLAIHPGRGRKMFLGYAESVVSSVLKYMASVVFALVAIVMYSAILSQTTGATAFIGSIIITALMFSYRKEITDIIGASNMGGKRLSNNVQKTMEKAGKGAKNIATAALGGAVGAGLAEGDMMKGATDSLKRELKRGRGLTARTLQQKDRTSHSMDEAKRRAMTQEKLDKEDLNKTENTDDIDNNDNMGGGIPTPGGTPTPSGDSGDTINVEMEDKSVNQMNVMAKQAVGYEDQQLADELKSLMSQRIETPEDKMKYSVLINEVNNRQAIMSDDKLNNSPLKEFERTTYENSTNQEIEKQLVKAQTRMNESGEGYDELQKLTREHARRNAVPEEIVQSQLAEARNTSKQFGNEIKEEPKAEPNVKPTINKKSSKVEEPSQPSKPKVNKEDQRIEPALPELNVEKKVNENKSAEMPDLEDITTPKSKLPKPKK